MFLIRWPIGRLILLLNFIFSPSAPKRSPQLQKEVDASTAHLSLYQLPACPFCVKTRRAMKRLGLNIELRNINQHEQYREELIREGGKRTVPCLKIINADQSITWMYESGEIIDYLEKFSR
ncbi:glutaredoxin [Colwellia sp. MB3u-70]|jgi:glutaredoxin|uniref:glutaredoxin family protein n=1 Tax=unclassified Colwellia TaxID=196834 RepID=UPI0015F62D3A|nr:MULTISPECIES: glutaredoxin [unclassified Colwellia]MBA6291904.1 glutaredoxin [Colwellia sp. MB3u-8]MBA6308548.1 glutaredoxin [Colwellia sp. MB3u-70]